MEEFSEENLPNFSIFSSSNTNKRFPWLQEEEINTLRSRNENSNTAKSTKMWLNVFNEWKLQRNERRFEKSRQQLEAKARELRVKGYGKRKNASHALNEEDEEFLWQSGQLGKHSDF